MRLILIGSGKLVYFLTRQFASKGYELTLICPDSDDARTLSRQFKATVILGDGSDPTILQDAEAYRADILLALTTQDQDNLVACQIAQQQFGITETLAIVNDPDNLDIFEKLGVTIAFSATEIIAHLLEQHLEFENIKNISPVAEGDINVMEVTLEENSPAVGKTLQELEVSSQAQITCIVRNQYITMPKRWTRLQVADHLIVVSRPEYVGPFLRALTGNEA